MAFIQNYTTLLDSLRAYLDRGNSTDPSVYNQLPMLIAMAEKRIGREVKPQGFEVYVTATFQASTPVYQKPERWRETFSFRIGTGTGLRSYTEIFPREIGYLRQYWPDPTVTGQPKYYADYGYFNFLVVPTPTLAYPWELGYYEFLQPLDSANQQNWLTNYAPNLMLFASLLECTPFLKNDDRIPVWQQEYERAARALMGEDIKKLSDKSEKRG